MVAPSVLENPPDPIAQVLTGNTIWVDAVNGNNATGLRGRQDKPFLTIAAALAASGIASGDVVFIRPGIYSLAAGITIPSNVTLRGAATKAVTIQMLGVVGATTLLTMGTDSRVEDVALILTSAAHVTLTGVLFPGTTSATAKLRDTTVAVNNSGAGAGASNVTGVLVQSTGTPSREVNAIRAVTITVSSTGTGTKRGVLQNTSVGNFSMRDVNVKVTSSGTGIGIETNIAGAIFTFISGQADADSADVSATAGAGTLELGAVILVNSTSNGKGFTVFLASSSLVWADDTQIPQAAVNFMRIGTSVVTADEQKIRAWRSFTLKTLSIRARIAPGVGGTLIVTVRKNGVDTLLSVTLSGATLTAQDMVNAVTFASGNDISVKVDNNAASNVTDITVTAEVY